jgi:hypothetical protein
MRIAVALSNMRRDNRVGSAVVGKDAGGDCS